MTLPLAMATVVLAALFDEKSRPSLAELFGDVETMVAEEDTVGLARYAIETLLDAQVGKTPKDATSVDEVVELPVSDFGTIHVELVFHDTLDGERGGTRTGKPVQPGVREVKVTFICVVYPSQQTHRGSERITGERLFDIHRRGAAALPSDTRKNLVQSLSENLRWSFLLLDGKEDR